MNHQIASMICVYMLMGLLVCNALYHLIASLKLRIFVSQSVKQPSHYPTVTLLKPLCGAKSGLAEALISHRHLEYPDGLVQIVFGVHLEKDTAVPVVKSLGFGELAIEHITPIGCNPKVSNLVSMSALINHDVIVISDSDIIMPPACLKSIIATMEQADVGLVTCLYKAEHTDNIWSYMGSMDINHRFLPSLMFARQLGRTEDCFGAVMALRNLLDSIGGFQNLLPYLADDYHLGRLVRESGKKVALAPLLVTTIDSNTTLDSLIAHETRWGRTIATLDPIGYWSSLVTHAIPLAVLSCFILSLVPHLGHSLRQISFAAALFALLARIVSVKWQAHSLKLNEPAVAMIMLRDFLSFIIHLKTLSPKSVKWRRQDLFIDKGGRIIASHN